MFCIALGAFIRRNMVCLYINVQTDFLLNLFPKCFEPFELTQQFHWKNQAKAVKIFDNIPGKPRPSLTWYQGKMELASNDDIRIDYKDSKGRLIMDNLSQSEALKFSCLAKNVAGEETSIAMVTVTGKFFFELFLQAKSKQMIVWSETLNLVLKLISVTVTNA